MACPGIGLVAPKHHTCARAIPAPAPYPRHTCACAIPAPAPARSIISHAVYPKYHYLCYTYRTYIELTIIYVYIDSVASYQVLVAILGNSNCTASQCVYKMSQI